MSTAISMANLTRPIILIKDLGQMGPQCVIFKKLDERFTSRCSECKAISRACKNSSNSKRPSWTFQMKPLFKCTSSSNKFLIVHTEKLYRSFNNSKISQTDKKKWIWQSLIKLSWRNTNASPKLRTASKWSTRGCKIREVYPSSKAQLDIPPQLPANKHLLRMVMEFLIYLNTKITPPILINNTTSELISHKLSLNSNRIFFLVFLTKRFQHLSSQTLIKLPTPKLAIFTTSLCTSSTNSKFKPRLSQSTHSTPLRRT